MTSADADVRTELPMSNVQIFDAERGGGSGRAGAPPRRTSSSAPCSGWPGRAGCVAS